LEREGKGPSRSPKELSGQDISHKGARDGSPDKERTDSIQKALNKKKARLVYLDCAVNETISVIARRLEGKGRSQEFTLVLQKFEQDSQDPYSSSACSRAFFTISSWIQ
jgi:hypothetical protein